MNNTINEERIRLHSTVAQIYPKVERQPKCVY